MSVMLVSSVISVGNVWAQTGDMPIGEPIETQSTEAYMCH